MTNNKTAIFIDGSNLHATAKALQINIDYKKLLVVFGEGLLRASYYTAVRDGAELDPLRPLVDWLSYNGYSLVTKPVKEFTDERGQRKTKGNMDVEIAVDCLELAPFITNAILFTGDGDFKALVDALHRRGVSVTVVSSFASNPPIVADELRRAADRFIDLADISDSISSPQPRSRYG